MAASTYALFAASDDWVGGATLVTRVLDTSTVPIPDGDKFILLLVPPAVNVNVPTPAIPVAIAEPKLGVIKVGELANTNDPVPIASVIMSCNCVELVDANCERFVFLYATVPPLPKITDAESVALNVMVLLTVTVLLLAIVNDVLETKPESLVNWVVLVGIELVNAYADNALVVIKPESLVNWVVLVGIELVNAYADNVLVVT